MGSIGSRRDHLTSGARVSGLSAVSPCVGGDIRSRCWQEGMGKPHTCFRGYAITTHARTYARTYTRHKRWALAIGARPSKSHGEKRGGTHTHNPPLRSTDYGYSLHNMCSTRAIFVPEQSRATSLSSGYFHVKRAVSRCRMCEARRNASEYCIHELASRKKRRAARRYASASSGAAATSRFLFLSSFPFLR